MTYLLIFQLVYKNEFFLYYFSASGEESKFRNNSNKTRVDEIKEIDDEKENKALNNSGDKLVLAEVIHKNFSKNIIKLQETEKLDSNEENHNNHNQNGIVEAKLIDNKISNDILEQNENEVKTKDNLLNNQNFNQNLKAKIPVDIEITSSASPNVIKINNILL